MAASRRLALTVYGTRKMGRICGRKPAQLARRATKRRTSLPEMICSTRPPGHGDARPAPTTPMPNLLTPRESSGNSPGGELVPADGVDEVSALGGSPHPGRIDLNREGRGRLEAESGVQSHALGGRFTDRDETAGGSGGSRQGGYGHGADGTGPPERVAGAVLLKQMSPLELRSWAGGPTASGNRESRPARTMPATGGNGSRGSEAAEGFLREAEARLLDLSVESQRAEWVHATYLSLDTADLAARAFARRVRASVEMARNWTRFDSADLPADLRRKGLLLRLSQSLVAPSGPGESEELAHRVAAMEGRYATFRVVLPGRKEPTDLEGLSRILAESDDPALMEAAWNGWHEVGRPMRADFLRYVDLANRGARELGFADTGEMWRSRYDMPPDQLTAEVERLWEQVAPLYRDLHRWVRQRLMERYPELVSDGGPIPAHLLGNMWAQSWESLSTGITPTGISGGPALTDVLRARISDPREMVRYAERFFTSIGFEPLPASFWERSMFSRPKDREVVCHASAWDLDFDQDVRIKMCIETTGEEFQVIHHELGHTYYQLACRRQPFLFRDSAHDGFHEALGDLIGLSVTPAYLARIGLAGADPAPASPVGGLLRIALDKVPFLPFSVAVDRWRWEVFSGRVGPDQLNRRWWELREELQGIAPPSRRDPDTFDAGAKYHIPASVPYLRYFLAYILQFQMHRALARASGWDGALHEFTIYGNREAGARLRTMMEMGQSRPWPEALESVTGERRMDASGLLEYFRPLRDWLNREQRR